MEGSNYWGYGYKTQHFHPMSRLKSSEEGQRWNLAETWWKKKQHKKNYQDEDKTSTIDKKLKINSQIKKPHLKMIPSYFSSHFSFLVIAVLLILVLFLFAVICLSLFFFMSSSSRRVEALTLSSILAAPLPPSFLDSYSLSMSSLGCQALFKFSNYLAHLLKFFTHHC